MSIGTRGATSVPECTRAALRTLGVRRIFWRISMFVACALCGMACATPAFAQLKTKLPNPDRLDFGQVRVGSTVEGSVSVMFEGTWTDGVPLQFFPPPCATVTATVQNSFSLEGFDRVFVAVYVKMSTEQAGVAEGPLIIRVGDEQVEVPLRAEVVEASPDSTRLLVVGSPFAKQTGNHAHFDAWRAFVNNANVSPNYVERPGGYWIRESEGDDYDVVIVSGIDLMRLSTRDIENALRFVREGGRLLVAASYSFRETVPATKPLLDPVGLRMEDSELPNNGVLYVGPEKFAKHPLLDGVSTIVIHRASPIEIVDPQIANALFQAPDVENRAYAAIGKLGEGDVVVLSQALWTTWIDPARHRTFADRDKRNDNARFLMNVLTRKDRPPVRPDRN